MKRAVILSLMLLAGLSLPVRGADWFTEFFSDIHRDTCRNHVWPEPFPQAERQAVNTPMNTMIANGWQRYNLLGDPHFEDDGKTLNQTGNLLIQRICFEPSPEHRTLFVARGLTPEITAARLAAVQRQAATYLENDAPVVVASRLQVEGAAADVAEKIRPNWLKNQPDAKLPAPGGGSGGGDSGASK